MKTATVLPDERQKRLLAEMGERLLKLFHTSYERDAVSPETENLRGQFTNWKRMVLMLCGDSFAEEMIYGVSERTRLSVPPGGPLADDGEGYMGWDSYCHQGFIGKLQ